MKVSYYLKVIHAHYFCHIYFNFKILNAKCLFSQLELRQNRKTKILHSENVLFNFNRNLYV